MVVEAKRLQAPLAPYTLFFLNIRTMVVEAKRLLAPVGFLDPESMSSTMLTHSHSFWWTI
jgi:hypothetical protein